MEYWQRSSIKWPIDAFERYNLYSHGNYYQHRMHWYCFIYCHCQSITYSFHQSRSSHYMQRRYYTINGQRCFYLFLVS